MALKRCDIARYTSPATRYEPPEVSDWFVVDDEDLLYLYQKNSHYEVRIGVLFDPEKEQ